MGFTLLSRSAFFECRVTEADLGHLIWQCQRANSVDAMGVDAKEPGLDAFARALTAMSAHRQAANHTFGTAFFRYNRLQLWSPSPTSGSESKD